MFHVRSTLRGSDIITINYLTISTLSKLFLPLEQFKIPHYLLGYFLFTSYNNLETSLNQSCPPASKGSREVANLTERKKSTYPVYGIKEFVCLSVLNFDPKYLRTGWTEWAQNFFLTSMAKTCVSKIFIFPKSRWQGWGSSRNSNFLTQYLSWNFKVCKFGCQTCFCKPIFLQKQLIYDSLAGNN